MKNIPVQISGATLAQTVGMRAVANRDYFICKISEDGKFDVSEHPCFHSTGAEASIEAERLANKNPGKCFAILQMVGGVMTPPKTAVLF